MPHPNPGENRKSYIGRCMAYPDMQKHPPAQRAAICFSMWKSAHPHSLGELVVNQVSMPHGLCPECGEAGLQREEAMIKCPYGHLYKEEDGIK